MQNGIKHNAGFSVNALILFRRQRLCNYLNITFHLASKWNNSFIKLHCFHVDWNQRLPSFLGHSILERDGLLYSWSFYTHRCRWLYYVLFIIRNDNPAKRGAICYTHNLVPMLNFILSFLNETYCLRGIFLIFGPFIFIEISWRIIRVGHTIMII
jgi:hypothetical protein